MSYIAPEPFEFARYSNDCASGFESTKVGANGQVIVKTSQFVTATHQRKKNDA